MKSTKITRSILEALADIPDADIARLWTNFSIARRRQIFSMLVRGDIKQVLMEGDPHIQPSGLGNQMDLGIQRDIDDGAISFTWRNTDIPRGRNKRRMTQTEIEELSKQRLARIVQILQTEMNLSVVEREYPRDATATPGPVELKQGAVVIKDRVYCADLIHGYSSPYRGRDEMIGYSFDVQINVSRTTLWLQVRFSERLPRNS